MNEEALDTVLVGDYVEGVTPPLPKHGRYLLVGDQHASATTFSDAEVRVAAYYADMDGAITEALHEHWLRGQPTPPRWVRTCQWVSRRLGGTPVFGHRDLT